jgi:5-methylcytosine-specific restriction endonuclease McrA
MRSRVIALVLLSAIFFLPGMADASGGSRASVRCSSCPRDSHGKIRRSREAVDKFKHANPKPPGCDRCQVDHVVPLGKGGADTPSNMQWLPKEQHQDKTKRDLRP